MPCPVSKTASAFRTSCVCPTGAALNATTDLCDFCAPGTRLVGGRCERCAVGTHQAEWGGETCDVCPDGSFAGRGAAKCRVCRNGTVPISESECGTCAAGETFVYPECVGCPAGTFKKQRGLEGCLPCGRGMYSMGGMARCVKCGNGTGLMRDGGCRACSAGTFYDEAAGGCRVCEAGSFAMGRHVRRSCFRCAGNAYSAAGANRCVVCPIGKALDRDGRCVVCGEGKRYERGSMRCVMCRAGFYGRGGEVNGRCERCPAGTFSLFGWNGCVYCKEGSVLMRKGGCGVCPRGTFYQEKVASCVECGKNSISEGGVVRECTGCGEGGRASVDRTICLM